VDNDYCDEVEEMIKEKQAPKKEAKTK